MEVIKRIQRVRVLVHSISTILIVLSLLLLARQAPLARILDTIEWFVGSAGLLAPLVHSLVYALAVLCFIPAAPITIIGGALFHPIIAIPATYLGAAAGSAAGFFIARHLARNKIERLFHRRKKLAALDKVLGEKGWRAVALMRWTPVLPMSLQNYVCGLSRIRFASYWLTSLVFMLPGIIIYTLIGRAAWTSAEIYTGDRVPNPYRPWVIAGIGVLLAFGWFFYIRRIARTTMETYLDMQPSPDSGDEYEPLSPLWPWDTLALATVAVLLFGFAGWATFDPAIFPVVEGGE